MNHSWEGNPSGSYIRDKTRPKDVSDAQQENAQTYSKWKKRNEAPGCGPSAFRTWAHVRVWYCFLAVDLFLCGQLFSHVMHSSKGYGWIGFGSQLGAWSNPCHNPSPILKKSLDPNPTKFTSDRGFMMWFDHVPMFSSTREHVLPALWLHDCYAAIFEFKLERGGDSAPVRRSLVLCTYVIGIIYQLLSVRPLRRLGLDQEEFELMSSGQRSSTCRSCVWLDDCELKHVLRLMRLMEFDFLFSQHPNFHPSLDEINCTWQPEAANYYKQCGPSAYSLGWNCISHATGLPLSLFTC